MKKLEVGDLVVMVDPPEVYKGSVGEIVSIEEGYSESPGFTVPTSYNVVFDGHLLSDLPADKLNRIKSKSKSAWLCPKKTLECWKCEEEKRAECRKQGGFAGYDAKIGNLMKMYDLADKICKTAEHALLTLRNGK